MISKTIQLFKKKVKNTQEINFSEDLKKLLGFKPNILSLYRVAFFHSSLKKDIKENNERLEFLGDSILDAIVAEYLFKKYPYKNEGFLSEMKSKIVNRQNLNFIGQKLNLRALLKSNFLNYQNHSNISGNTLEALIGAIYLDKGYSKTYKWIIDKIILPFVSLEHLENLEANVKNKLFQWATKNHKEVEFRLMNENKTSSRKCFFEISIFLDNVEFSTGKGFTKKEAEQNATIQALEKIF